MEPRAHPLWKDHDRSELIRIPRTPGAHLWRVFVSYAKGGKAQMPVLQLTRDEQGAKTVRRARLLREVRIRESAHKPSSNPPCREWAAARAQCAGQGRAR